MPSRIRPRRRYTAMECLVSPDSSVLVRSYACRSTPATAGHDASGGAANVVVTVGSPTALSTGVFGQLAAAALSSLNAWAAAAALAYSTASVLSAGAPTSSVAATCTRWVRRPSLG